MTKFQWLPVALFLLIIYAPECISLTPEQQLAVDELVENVFMEYNRIPGVGLTVIETSGNASMVYAKGYGHQDVDAGILATSSTKFCIASISKTFTSTLLMKVLSENFPELGSSVLDVPIRQLHPMGTFTFSDRYRSEFMTFRDLLSHRHGLETESLGSSAGAYFDLKEMVYRMRYAKEAGPFRAFPYYSNTGYVLVGQLLEEIANVPYLTLLQTFFDDLGMSESTFVMKDEDYETFGNMSKGYYLRDGEVLNYNMSLINRIFLAPSAGGLITTSNDMAKYMAFHLSLGKVGDNQIISEESMKWLRQSAFALDGISFKTPESDYVTGAYALGTGFQLGVLEGWSYITHSGQYTPFMSDMRMYPDLGLGVFAVNNGPVNLYDSAFGYPYVQEEMLKIVRGQSLKTYKKSEEKFIPKPRKPSTLSKTVQEIDQSNFPGVYGHPVEGELEIFATPDSPNGPLYLQYGTWATGYLTTYPDLPNGFLINWDTDLLQEIYFGAGTAVDMLAQFIDQDTLVLDVGGVHEFKRGVTLITLPDIPWNATSCGPSMVKVL